MNTRPAALIKESQLKRACLLFDKIIVQYNPAEFDDTFKSHKDIAEKVAENVIFKLKAHIPNFQEIYGSADLDETIRRTSILSMASHQMEVKKQVEKCGVTFHTSFGHESLVKKQLDAICLFEVEYSDEQNNIKDGISCYTACLNQVPIADEANLDWIQIQEFRTDNDSLRQYRTFHKWIEVVLKSKSQIEAEDILYEKLEQYSRALKKHSIITTTGVLKQVLSSEVIASGALSGWLASEMTQESIIGGITAGLLVSSKVALELVDFIKERESIYNGENSEIAYIYEINKKLGS